MLKRTIITVTSLLCMCVVAAQTADFIDLGKLKEYDTVLKRLSYFIDYSKKATIDDAAQATFSYTGKNFPFDKRKLDASYFIKLSATNSSRQDTFWLYMGRAQHYTMYEYDSSIGKMKALNNQFTSFSHTIFNHVPYAFIIVKAGQYKDFYIEADINFYNWHQFDPIIVLPNAQTSFAFDHFLQPNKLYIYVTLLLLGIMLSMLAYTLAVFLQDFKYEYLYYALAMLGFIIYFFLRLLNNFVFGSSYFFFYDFRYQVLQLGESTLALLFVSSFLKLKTIAPGLHTHVRIITFAQLIFLIINLPLTYTNRYNYIGNIAFDAIRGIVVPYFVYLIFSLLKYKNDKAVRYIGIGSVTGIITWGVALYIDGRGDYKHHFLEHSSIAVVGFMTGIVIEMLFFMKALSYRKRSEEILRIRAVEKLQLENDRKELEKYKAIIDTRENERSRISQEIHDDIGSGLTSIRLLSEIAKAKEGGTDKKELEKISATANVLIEKMNEIIWTLNLRNDALPSLIAYLRHYIVEYFESLNIQIMLSVPDAISEISINGKTRRNILLSVKEALHNIVKHSQATEVNIMFLVNDFFFITITDNGVGFNPALDKSHGNGLHNMEERFNAIGGTCTIINNGGTSIVFKVPLINDKEKK
ncbi:MAG: hypothetical protein KF746_16435 [Chitinophagaceae bacterium]|nr:hypothetical protein [Chitinophagaceae bacterium]